jgi:cyclopropane fatty-acyl-phospholipid synthase-like methyltransferase
VRARPSNVVLDFLAATGSLVPPGASALDIGCGTGRNAIYLAEQGYSVMAMDFCAPQIDALVRELRARPNLKVQAVTADVTSRWPWGDASATLAIDTFCFKHVIDPQGIATYIEQLRRCLAPGGVFMLFLATRRDGYYRQFGVAEQFGTGEIILDPGNNIASRLYERDEIEHLFRNFEVLSFREKAGENLMHGARYQRSSAVWHMRHRG